MLQAHPGNDSKIHARNCELSRCCRSPWRCHAGRVRQRPAARLSPQRACSQRRLPSGLQWVMPRSQGTAPRVLHAAGFSVLGFRARRQRRARPVASIAAWWAEAGGHPSVCLQAQKRVCFQPGNASLYFLSSNNFLMF